MFRVGVQPGCHQQDDRCNVVAGVAGDRVETLPAGVAGDHVGGDLQGQHRRRGVHVVLQTDFPADDDVPVAVQLFGTDNLDVTNGRVTLLPREAPAVLIGQHMTMSVAEAHKLRTALDEILTAAMDAAKRDELSRWSNPSSPPRPSSEPQFKVSQAWPCTCNRSPAGTFCPIVSASG